ncbi:uncharacterized protein KRP23_15113 [Phytophthora ramorum]|uniref:uncharacterized protein n=1 Tax=Phytophthora ramorum TaxID=164328 RepID=UPI0030AB86AC|nr:hypothetical protein KRP23_15113 [Phytophthora ramorum]
MKVFTALTFVLSASMIVTGTSVVADGCKPSRKYQSAVEASSTSSYSDLDATSSSGDSSVDVGGDDDSIASHVRAYDDYDATGSASYSSSRSISTPFQKVKSLQARVQGDMPKWDADNQRFVSKYYTTFDEKYRAVLDTVNMAAVEGALKYVQAECINASVVTDCKRKNNIQYVVFYETTVVQPAASMGYYASATDESDYAIEHCPFMPMDGGQCDPNADGSFPDVCNHVSVSDDGVTWLDGLDFWANPGDSDANAERAEKLVSAYGALVEKNSTTTDGGEMQPLPTVSELTTANPPCYENSEVCAEAEFGCKRSYRSQICEVCTSTDSNCVKNL